MNNEETILDPQYSAESKASNETSEPKNSTVDNAEKESASKKETKAKKDNNTAGKVAAAVVGVAAGVGAGMYADDAMAAVMPQSENNEEPVAEKTNEHEAAEKPASHTQEPNHQQASGEPVKTPNGQDGIIETGQADIDGDGELDDYIIEQIEGETVLIADTTHDGEVNVMIADRDGNNQISGDEMLDVTAEHIAMPFASGSDDMIVEPQQMDDDVVYASQPIEEDPDVHVLAVGQDDLNDDGMPENIAVFDVEGQEVVLVDIDLDAQAEELISDFDGDGQIQEEELVDISDQNIEMPTMSDGDMYMDQAADEPDYTNDADIDFYEA